MNDSIIIKENSHVTNQARFEELSNKVWNVLNDDEKEGFYCGDGTYGFVERMAEFLQVELSNNYCDEDCERFDQMVNRIIKGSK